MLDITLNAKACCAPKKTLFFVSLLALALLLFTVTLRDKEISTLTLRAYLLLRICPATLALALAL